jgi:SAM-dependent methyltransferase
MNKEKITILIVVATFCTVAIAAPPQETGQIKQQSVTVEDFSAEGLILDIGGGGEGLEEAPSGPLKIVMDARDLKFLDDTFNTATVFFTFMYIDSNDHQKVFEELQRVLKPGGRLLIWDVTFPELTDKKKNMALFPFKFNLPDKQIRTGYGVRRPEREQGLAHLTID